MSLNYQFIPEYSIVVDVIHYPRRWEHQLFIDSFTLAEEIKSQTNENIFDNIIIKEEIHILSGIMSHAIQVM